MLINVEIFNGNHEPIPNGIWDTDWVIVSIPYTNAIWDTDCWCKMVGNYLMKI